MLSFSERACHIICFHQEWKSCFALRKAWFRYCGDGQRQQIHNEKGSAYEKRYKTAHANGVSWSSNVSTPIVTEVIDRYKINRQHRMPEIGCGEGRDSKTVLEHGFPLMATDISKEAITYCKQQMPRYQNHFSV